MPHLAEKALKGDVLSGARLIRLLEEGDPDGIEELKVLYPHTGRAYPIGINPLGGQIHIGGPDHCRFQAPKDDGGCYRQPSFQPLSGQCYIGGEEPLAPTNAG